MEQRSYRKDGEKSSEGTQRILKATHVLEENASFSVAVKTEGAFPMTFNAVVRATSRVGRGKQKIRLLGTW